MDFHLQVWHHVHAGEQHRANYICTLTLQVMKKGKRAIPVVGMKLIPFQTGSSYSSCWWHPIRIQEAPLFPGHSLYHHGLPTCWLGTAGLSWHGGYEYSVARPVWWDKASVVVASIVWQGLFGCVPAVCLAWWDKANVVVASIVWQGLCGSWPMPQPGVHLLPWNRPRRVAAIQFCTYHSRKGWILDHLNTLTYQKEEKTWSN